MAVPEECSESKERIATRDAHCSRSRVHQVASKRAPEDRTAPQRFDGFARDLERGPGLTFQRFPLLLRHMCHAKRRAIIAQLLSGSMHDGFARDLERGVRD